MEVVKLNKVRDVGVLEVGCISKTLYTQLLVL